MTNERIRIALLVNGIKQWELAKMLGVSEMTIVRRLRDEMPEEEQGRIVNLIEEHALKGGQRNE